MKEFFFFSNNSFNTSLRGHAYLVHKQFDVEKLNIHPNFLGYCIKKYLIILRGCIIRKHVPILGSIQCKGLEI